MNLNYRCPFEETKKKDLKEQPAILILEYPEGKSLITKANSHIATFIHNVLLWSQVSYNTHTIYDKICEDFMKYANKKYYQPCDAANDINICVHYCENEEENNFLFNLILYKIKLNGKTDLYYNSIYPTEVQLEELERIYLDKQKEIKYQEEIKDFNVNINKITRDNLRELKAQEYTQEVMTYKNKHYTEFKYDSYGCCSVNFRDSFGMKKYDGFISPDQPTSFNPIICSSLEELCTNPGVYQITFSNKKKYIGKSNDIRKRIMDHLFNIRYGRTAAKWYSNIYNYYEIEGKTFETLYEYFNYIISSGKLEIHYTKTEEQASQLEKIELAKIYQDKELRDQYYNSQYYIEEKGRFKLINAHLHNK